MKRCILVVFSVLLLCGLAAAPTAAQSTDTPQEAVEQFYAWYLDYAASANPLVNRAYRDSPYLHSDLVQALDELLEEGLFYDPILCAQDIPEEVFITGLIQDEANASALLNTSFAEHELVVVLTATDERWLITEIACGLTPPAAALAFYIRYINYADAGSDFRNPLVDGFYRNSPYLTEQLIAEMDEALTEGLFYDPFLCAQDLPLHLSAGPALITGERADLAIHTSFEGHGFTLAMQQVQPGRWQIDSVACGPTETVQQFYDWYLLYTAYDPEAGSMSNPLVDRVYHDSPYLTEDWIAEVDEIIAGFTISGYDPFLCAQNIPQLITVSPVEVASASAALRVDTDFAGDHHFFVFVDKAGGPWQISSIVCSR